MLTGNLLCRRRRSRDRARRRRICICRRIPRRSGDRRRIEMCGVDVGRFDVRRVRTRTGIGAGIGRWIRSRFRRIDIFHGGTFASEESGTFGLIQLANATIYCISELKPFLTKWRRANRQRLQRIGRPGRVFLGQTQPDGLGGREIARSDRRPMPIGALEIDRAG
jgi:hypothetical protein